MTEHEQQKMFFQWLRLAYPRVVAFAIPNGGARHIAVAKKLKAEGVVAGVPDIMIADGRPGLFIEMKAGKNVVSKSQVSMIKALRDTGYSVAVCYGFDEAKHIAEKYLNKRY